MKSTIVVGWDGSPTADRAMAWAIERAEITHELILMTNIVQLEGPLSTDAVQQAIATEHWRTDAAAQRLNGPRPHLVINTRTLAGDPLDELLAASREDNLVVVGTRERRGLQFRYHWSLGAKLAGAAHGPVAIIPPLEAGRSGVVVGVDGSEVSLKAARVAAIEAQRRHEALHIVHAWLEPMVDVPDLSREDTFITELQHQHQVLLDSAMHIMRKNHPELTIRPHLVRDVPHHALTSTTAEASLLVVGARHPGGLQRLLLGSVSHEMVLDIRIPTIVVPAGTAI